MVIEKKVSEIRPHNTY